MGKSNHSVLVDGWDLTQLADAYEKSIETERDEEQSDQAPVKKELTREEKTVLHLALIEAVKRKDAKEVRDLFDKGAEFTLPNGRAQEDVMGLALDHFSPKVFEALTKQGGALGFRHFLSGSDEKNEAAAWLLEHFGQWKISSSAQNTLRQDNNLDQNQPISCAMFFEPIYREALCNEWREDIGEKIEMCGVIDQSCPEIMAKVLKELNQHDHQKSLVRSFYNILSYGDADQVDHFARSHTELGDWRRLMIGFFHELNHEHLWLWPSDFSNLNHLLLNHTQAREGFAQASTDLAEKHQRALDYYLTEPLPLLDWLVKDPQQSKIYFQSTIDYRLSSFQSNPDPLGWPLGWRVLRHKSFLSDIAGRVTDDQLDHYVSSSPLKDYLKTLPKPPRTYPKTLTGILLQRQSTCLNMICQTEEGKRAILAAMNDPLTAYEFAQDDKMTLLKTVLKAVPELIAWRDPFGNSLAHYFMNRGYLTKTMVETVARIDPDWMMCTNAAGVSARDMAVKTLGEKSSAVVSMDKILIKKSMRQDKSVSAKMNARHQKRRM